MRQLAELDQEVLPSFWRSLRYFGIYRLIIAAVFLLSVTLDFFDQHLDFGVQNPALFKLAALAYGLACVVSLLTVWRVPRFFSIQLGAQVVIDIVVYLVLMQASGGAKSGVGLLLLVSLAAAALVGEGRLVLFYAALASIGVLFLQVAQTLVSDLDPTAFLRAGILSLAFFATATLARLLARRLVASEELARRRGEDLRRQLRLTTRVIAMLEDGVLVASPDGKVLQANPKARSLLNLHDERWGRLGDLSPELADGFQSWRRIGMPERIDCSRRFRPDFDALLNAHFVDVPEAGGDALIFLQDVGEAREQERRVKLAALGRLTAGVAHEIRNPLSSIRHATELMREDCHDPATRRMHEIVLDNADRLERIVRDVLELGKRDKTTPQLFPIGSFLESFLPEFLAAANWPQQRILIEMTGQEMVRFDPAHLRQVLWNLLSNAGRYASDREGGVRMVVEEQPLRISVEDDGPGVPEGDVAKLFEPFHTTSKKGNGLGLYIARELCEANGFRLLYAQRTRGACFVISGGG